MWPGFGVLHSLWMGGLGKRFLGKTSPATVPPASKQGEQKYPSKGKKKVPPPQAGIYNRAVIFSLPPSILPSSPSSTLLTPNAELEALSSPAARAGGMEHLVLHSGDPNQCQGRKGSWWVSCAAARTLSSDVCPALYHATQEGCHFAGLPGGFYPSCVGQW